MFRITAVSSRQFFFAVLLSRPVAQWLFVISSISSWSTCLSEPSSSGMGLERHHFLKKLSFMPSKISRLVCFFSVFGISWSVGLLQSEWKRSPNHLLFCFRCRRDGCHIVLVQVSNISLFGFGGWISSIDRPSPSRVSSFVVDLNRTLSSCKSRFFLQCKH